MSEFEFKVTRHRVLAPDMAAEYAGTLLALVRS